MSSDSVKSSPAESETTIVEPAAYPPGTRVRATLTLRCSAGFREVVGNHSHDAWAAYMNEIDGKRPIVFDATDEHGITIGEERIFDTSIIISVSSYLILPGSQEVKY